MRISISRNKRILAAKPRRRRGRSSTSRAQRTAEAADAPSNDLLQVKVIRSRRRKKTVGARLLNWYTMEVRAPADLPEAELQAIIAQLKAKLLRERQNLRRFASDEALERRAKRLNKELFDNALHWRSIRFVSNQNSRFGSCSPKRGTIRISHRLTGVPSFVLDYVIVHELAHLLEPNHSKAFWELVYRYPKTERARGYLMAMQLEDDAIESDGPEMQE